jgi:hypothetical protein
MVEERYADCDYIEAVAAHYMLLVLIHLRGARSLLRCSLTGMSIGNDIVNLGRLLPSITSIGSVHEGCQAYCPLSN